MLRLVQVLVECVWWVNRLICLGGVLASVLEDNLGATGVLWHELCDIVGASVNNNPA